mgnify:FL=1
MQQQRREAQEFSDGSIDEAGLLEDQAEKNGQQNHQQLRLPSKGDRSQLHAA